MGHRFAMFYPIYIYIYSDLDANRTLASDKRGFICRVTSLHLRVYPRSEEIANATTRYIQSLV